MDRGAWWAAVHGVAQSRTQLKRLSMHACMYWRRKWQPTPVFLPGESQGQKSLVGCHLWGLTELGMTEVTQQQQQHAFIAYCKSQKLWERNKKFYSQQTLFSKVHVAINFSRLALFIDSQHRACATVQKRGYNSHSYRSQNKILQIQNKHLDFKMCSLKK